jgi:hypothetical protein
VSVPRLSRPSKNSTDPAGVAVDGRNDEALGNLDDPCNPFYDTSANPNDTSAVDQAYRQLYRQVPGLCAPLLGQEQLQFPYHQSIDVPDLTRSELNASLQWNVTAGPYGTIVDRYQIDRLSDESAGGLAQASVLAVPYYRDDSCFDDGTGTDPGPRVRLRSSSEPRTYVAADGTTQPRQCWKPSDGDPAGSPKYFQGDIATHGVHILMIAESDNARQTVPLTEIVSEQRMVFLPGDQGNVGEQYGRSFEKPLVATATDYSGTPASKPGGGPKAGSNGGTADGSGFATPRRRVTKPKFSKRGKQRRMAVYTDNGSLRVVAVKRSR